MRTDFTVTPSLSRRNMLLLGSTWLSGGCHQSKTGIDPAIEFTKLPSAGEGSPNRLETIEGRVRGAKLGQRVVIYARAGIWWVQPFGKNPFTTIGSDCRWRNSTHPGTAYAALLVNPGYSPPPTAQVLPLRQDDVVALVTADGVAVHRVSKTLRFSGYEWAVRSAPSDSGGTPNNYDPANAWVDSNGSLHLRIAKSGDGWTSAAVKYPQSLGYGTYSFTVSDISPLPPGAVLTFSLSDNSAPPREADIEISRWGELANRNAQYVIQPYYVPQNTIRFAAPGGTLVHTIRWQPGQISFETTRSAGVHGSGSVVSSHVFTSGIPSPGSDAIQMNLYVFANRRNPIRDGAEVIIEHFEYLP